MKLNKVLLWTFFILMLVSAVINTTAHVAAIILFIIAVLVFAMFIFRVSRSDDNDLGPSDGAKL